MINFLFTVVIINLNRGFDCKLFKRSGDDSRDLDTEGDIIIQNGTITNDEISGFGAIVIETH